MNCFECAANGHANSAVVAICAQCGAASCIDHTVTGRAYVEIRSLGTAGHHGLPGRRLYCTDCAPESAAQYTVATAS